MSRVYVTPQPGVVEELSDRRDAAAKLKSASGAGVGI
jgi:hypothetical protein